MADNVPLTEDAARKAATDQVTHSGDTAEVQLVRVVETTGAEGSKTVVNHDHDAGNAGPGTQRVVEADDSPLTVAAEAIQAALGSALPLPTGAATAARQDTGNTALAAILLAVDGLEAALAAVATEASLAALGTATGDATDPEAVGNGSLIAIVKRLRTLLNAGLPAALGAGGGVKVDGSGTPLPVNGTVAVTGVATEAKQDTGNASLATIITHVDGLEALLTTIAGHVDTLETLLGGTLAVSAASLPLPTGAATSANQATAISALATLITHVDGLEALLAGTLAVSAASLPLPTGAATSAKQDSQTTLLAGGLPAALGAGGGLKVDGSGTALPVSAASLPLPSGAATEATLGDVRTAVQLLDDVVKAEDVASASGDKGLVIHAKRSDAPAATSDTDGDYEPLQVRRGRLLVDAIDRKRISVQSGGLTTASTSYSAGDQVGTLFTVADAARVSGSGGEIVGVQLIDAADVVGPIDVVFFRASVTLAADNAAFAISDSDALEIVGLVHLLGAYDIGNNRLCQAHGIRVSYDCSGGTSLYAALITRADHTFFAAVGNLQLVVQLIRD